MDKTILRHNNIFLRYDNLKKSDFILSSIWVEYYLPDELDIFRKNGVTEDWIYKNIFTYEEIKKGNASIYYSIIGDNFFLQKNFVIVKSIIIINEKFYYIGYQTIIKKKPKSLDIYLGRSRIYLLYLTDLWDDHNKKAMKKISHIIGEEVFSIRILTDSLYKSIVKSNGIFSLQGVEFSNL